MTRGNWLAAIVAVLLAMNAGSIRAQATSPSGVEADMVEGMSVTRLQWIDHHLRGEVERRHIGSAVGLIARNGTIVYHEAYGEADPGVPIVAVLLTPTLLPRHAEVFELFQRSMCAAIVDSYTDDDRRR